MMMRRRTVAQLTPLLDLLLIVIFAQYLDVRETSAKSVQDVEFSAQITEAELGRLRRTVASLETQLSISNKTLEETLLGDTDRQREMARLRNEQGQLVSEIKSLRQQRDDIARLSQQAFGIPGQLISRFLSTEMTDQQKEQLKVQVRELAQKNPSRMTEHLLEYNELRKRCDIWELHVSANGLIEFKIDGKTLSFRSQTSEEFLSKGFEVFKGLPQPKSLVLIMVSYGDARADVRSAVTKGLPVLAERMRADTSGRIRFEYAMLGYQPNQ